MKKDEKNFEQQALELKQKISELQAPAVKGLDPEDLEALRRDRELRSKSANYRLLGEDEKADALESEILNLQPRVKKVKQKLAQQPSGQQQIYSTIAATPDSKLHKEALAVQKAGLVEYNRILAEIEASEKELNEIHNSLVKNAGRRGKVGKAKGELVSPITGG